MKKIYKKQYNFGDPVKYRIFLKAQILKLNPRLYSVVCSRSIDTTSGPMCALKLITDIANPNLEPIAECWINDQFIYLWREHCWAIAVTSNGQEVFTYTSFDEPKAHQQKNKFDIAPKPCNKVLVIHKIGDEPISN